MFRSEIAEVERDLDGPGTTSVERARTCWIVTWPSGPTPAETEISARTAGLLYLYRGTGILDPLETRDSSHRREMRLRHSPPRSVEFCCKPEHQSVQVPVPTVRSRAARPRLDRRGLAIPGWPVETSRGVGVGKPTLARTA